MTPILGQCRARSCKHYRDYSSVEETQVEDVEDSQIGPEVCLAYPDGIPKRIIDGEDLHATVQPDQDGTLVYEEGPWDMSRVYVLGELRTK